MHGRLAAMIALAAGCSFDGPGLGTDAATPDAATVDAPMAGCTTAYDFDYGGHKYRLVSSGVSWAAARSTCEADGGYLLKIDSADEDQEVEDAYLFGPREVWIGLRDASGDGNYRWTDGTAPTFAHWSSTPDAASPDCVVKDTYATDGQWYTRNCADSRAAICECTP